MEGLKQKLAEAEAARAEILKKMEEFDAPVVRKDIDDLRKELTDLILKRTAPPAPYCLHSGNLAMTDISVFGPEKWDDTRVDGPTTKPSRREKVALPSWDEMPTDGSKSK